MCSGEVRIENIGRVPLEEGAVPPLEEIWIGSGKRLPRRELAIAHDPLVNEDGERPRHRFVISVRRSGVGREAHQPDTEPTKRLVQTVRPQIQVGETHMVGVPEAPWAQRARLEVLDESPVRLRILWLAHGTTVPLALFDFNRRRGWWTSTTFHLAFP